MLPPTCEILDEAGKEYFRRTREQWFGKKLEEFSPEGPIREGHWKALQDGFDKIAGILDKNGVDALYVAEGTEPTWGDFVLISWLLWIKIVLPDDWEKRTKRWSGGRWEKLINRTEEWQTVG